MCIYHAMCVEGSGQAAGVASLLPARGSYELNLSHQGQQKLSTTVLSHHPFTESLFKPMMSFTGLSPMSHQEERDAETLSCPVYFDLNYFTVPKISETKTEMLHSPAF